MKALKDCRYSAFISYAHASDGAHGRWVTQFREELFTALRGRLRGAAGNVPPIHLSGDNGPAGGLLGPELQRNIADSFAMIIMVEENYIASSWCLKELEYFNTLFGSEGFAERVYVVAMSEPAVKDLSKMPDWIRLAPPDLIWRPFFRPDEPDRPLRVYMDNKDVLTGTFEDQLERILKRLVDSARKPAPSLPPAPPPLLSRLDRAGLLFGVPAPEFAQETARLAVELRRRGVAVTELSADVLQRDFSEFDAARQLVLAIGNGGTALAPFMFTAGGHLAAQRDAWNDKHPDGAGLLWLDLRASPCAAPAGKGHAQLLNEVSASARSPQALLQDLAPGGGEGEGGEDDPCLDRVNIYIESNQNDVDVWEDLGERIKKRWAAIIANDEPITVPPLRLHARGLPLQQIDNEPLDDADGLVLLWGNKTDSSLRAQIDKVERKLVIDPPPGIVAYLIPQREDPKRPVEANYWKVLRFQDSTSPRIDIEPTEAERLDKFLRKILDRKAKRKAPAAAGRARVAG